MESSYFMKGRLTYRIVGADFPCSQGVAFVRYLFRYAREFLKGRVKVFGTIWRRKGLQ